MKIKKVEKKDKKAEIEKNLLLSLFILVVGMFFGMWCSAVAVYSQDEDEKEVEILDEELYVEDPYDDISGLDTDDFDDELNEEENILENSGE